VAEETLNNNILIIKSDTSSNSSDSLNLMYYNSMTDLNKAWDGSKNAQTIDEFIINEGFQKLGTINIGGIVSPEFLEGAAGGNNFDVLTLHTGHIYMFQLVGKEKLTDTDSQILSTFKFTK
jgi:Na+-translocating ferredoxin:NAD+ oxidoreductase RnfD subunit